MFLQLFGEEFLCNDPCLGESVHAFLDLAVYLSIQGCYVPQFVLLDDVVWHVRKFQPHVFVHGHRSIQIEILYVHCEESSTRSEYYAIDEELDSK